MKKDREEKKFKVLVHKEIGEHPKITNCYYFDGDDFSKVIYTRISDTQNTTTKGIPLSDVERGFIKKHKLELLEIYEWKKQFLGTGNRRRKKDFNGYSIIYRAVGE